MTEHDDLRILRRLAAAQQDQPAKDPDRDQIQQTNRHEPRSCPSPLTRPNGSSEGVHRVLKRYRLLRALGSINWDAPMAPPAAVWSASCLRGLLAGTLWATAHPGLVLGCGFLTARLWSRTHRR